MRFDKELVVHGKSYPGESLILEGLRVINSTSIGQ